MKYAAQMGSGALTCAVGFIKIGSGILCLSIHLSMALQPFVGPLPFFQFLSLYTAGRIP
jgi:hypothetical protein